MSHVFGGADLNVFQVNIESRCLAIVTLWCSLQANIVELTRSSRSVWQALVLEILRS